MEKAQREGGEGGWVGGRMSQKVSEGWRAEISRFFVSHPVFAFFLSWPTQSARFGLEPRP